MPRKQEAIIDIQKEKRRLMMRMIMSKMASSKYVKKGGKTAAHFQFFKKLSFCLHAESSCSATRKKLRADGKSLRLIFLRSRRNAGLIKLSYYTPNIR